MKSKLEIALHILFWIYIFSAVNVEWNTDWFDQSIRTNTPAPLSLLIFPIYFYVNAFLLIPKYFSLNKWKQYALFAFILFFLPEMIRLAFYTYRDGSQPVEALLFNRDSFIFGSPSAFFIALNMSFIYRLGLDWLRNEGHTKPNSEAIVEPARPYENNALMDHDKAEELKKSLEQVMASDALYLKSELSLRELADSVSSNEKKISYVINQHMDSNFYEWVNRYRIEKFKEEISKPESENLSIVGVALNCGFPSKSSFYRAFKSEVGVSPSQYLKNQRKPK